MSAITMIATATAKPGMGDKLEKIIRASIQPTRAEDGNLHYSLHRSIEDPDVFVFVERWASMEALQAHGMSAHVEEILGAAAEVMAGAPEARILTVLDDGALKGRLG